MRCPHCKKETNDELTSCEHCGESLKDSTNQQNSSFSDREKDESEPPPRKHPDHIKDDSEAPPRKHAKSTGSTESDDAEKAERNSHRRDKDNEDSPSKNLKSKKGGATTWIVAIALAFIVLLIVQQFRKEPPVNPPPAAFNVNDEAEFFNMLGSEIAELNRARYYFRAAGMLRLANESAAMPESARYQPVAENYAKALEHFNHAKRVLEEGPRIDNPKAAPCRKSFAEIAGRYASAADIFNEHAKDLSQDETDQANRAPLTDAQAKYEIADQLMSAFLMEGCQGEYFKFIQSRSDAEKKQAYTNYQNFYGDHFPAIQSTIQTYFGYAANPVLPTPAPSTLPAAPHLPQ